MAAPMAPMNSISGPGVSVERTTRMKWLMYLAVSARNLCATTGSKL